MQADIGLTPLGFCVNKLIVILILSSSISTCTETRF
jgi:hypothetical protein